MMSDELMNELRGFHLKADEQLDRRVLSDIDQWTPVPTQRPVCLRWSQWAAVLVLATLLTWFYMPRSVAWSQIAERFESVPYVRISLNLSNEHEDYAQHMDVWLGSQGQLRIQTRSQVIFAEQGRIVKAADLQGQDVARPDSAACEVIQELGAWESFSLETLIRAVLQEPLVDVTPADDVAQVVWRDLMVFDSRASVGAGRIRIYALRDSKLPVSFRIWDTADGLAIEAMFLYEKEPPANIFLP